MHLFGNRVSSPGSTQPNPVTRRTSGTSRLRAAGVLSLGLDLGADDLRRFDISLGDLGTVRWSAFKGVIFWAVLGYLIALVVQGALLLAWPRTRRPQGALQAARGALLLGFCAWLNTASPLAATLGLGSFGDFTQRMAMLAQSPPVPLAPIVTIFVVSLAVSGVLLLLRGLWDLATGGAGREPGRPHELSNSAP